MIAGCFSLSGVPAAAQRIGFLNGFQVNRNFNVILDNFIQQISGVFYNRRNLDKEEWT
jgi:hypothetical protein